MRSNFQTLKVFGYNWGVGEMKRAEKVYSICVVVTVSVCSLLLLFHRRNFRFFESVDDTVISFLHFYRNLLNVKVSLAYLTSSMFFRKSRASLYGSVDSFVETAQRLSRTKTLTHNRVSKAFAGIFYAHVLLVFILYYALFDKSFYLKLLDSLSTMNDFVTVNNKFYFNLIIYYLYAQVKSINKLARDGKLSAKDTLVLKLKLIDTIKLFNKCFGHFLLIDVLKTFMDWTYLLYFHSARILLGFSSSAMILYVFAFQALPMHLASLMLFIWTEKLKTQEGFLLKYCISIVDVNITDWSLGELRRRSTGDTKNFHISLFDWQQAFVLCKETLPPTKIESIFYSSCCQQLRHTTSSWFSSATSNTTWTIRRASDFIEK